MGVFREMDAALLVLKDEWLLRDGRLQRDGWL